MTHLLRTLNISITIGLIFSLWSLKSFSQTTHLKALVNEVISNFNYGKSNSEMKPYKKDTRGLLVGASFQAGITPLFSVVTETYFAMKGGILKTGNPLTTNKSRVRLYNVELPMLARIHLGRFYVNSGPYISYTIAGKIKTEAGQSIPEKSTRISFRNVHNGFKRWEMGVQAGAGYNFRIKRTTLAMDLRYGYGLTSISQDTKRYNRAFSISIIAVKAWKTNPFEWKR